ncbi:serpin peptidase inhibitor, clade B (ovalbumin), member 1, like 3 [Syngnathoides biaculeatus]|uniref:serpin peptidase inhibitor, clade B (ovalbumin), member 1, like 3 n=1 Tax=Syngnathoides biaculeatus TaxID=300417 RepID=UPI002ADE62F4|nr:serpin peptidase inhibitor, clade B (ovalbumin), member 1, like 3 [Syngnathoides biaculeatus]
MLNQRGRRRRSTTWTKFHTIFDTMAPANPPAEANATFSLALFKKLSEKDKNANIFFSPFSISSALAMTMLGARGNTATQMSEVLYFTKATQPTEEKQENMATHSSMQTQIKTREQMRSQLQQSSRLPHYLKQVLKRVDGENDVHAHFQQLLIEFNKTKPGYALSLANRLYVQQSYPIDEGFLSETRKYYQAELESLDFKENEESAREKINSWVEEKTQGKIKDLINQKLKEEVVMVLVNAIYFKGKWQQEFNKDLTREAPFKINKNATKPVEMMSQKSKFNYAFISEVNCQILEMPYEGKDVSMLIFLPNEIEDDTTGLEKLEQELTYEKMMTWTRSDHMELEVEVQVGLPRFKLEVTSNLGKVLVSMGMLDAFDEEKSDFSGMTSANDLALSKVIHKAFVEVNEEGTEAAAATAVVVVEVTSIGPPEVSKTFIADHSFLFFIRHNPSNTILFAGQYTSPEVYDFSAYTMASSTSVSTATTNFCLDLLKRLSDNDKAANIFFSPLSISSALAMVMLGSGGNTATQMSKVLRFTEPELQPPPMQMQMQQQVQSSLPLFLLKGLKTQGQDDVHANFAKLLAELNKPGALYALSVANRLYGEQSYQFVEDFLSETRKHYKAELETVDFIKNHEAARVNINQWVEKETQGKIKDVLAQGVLDNMTRLVLVNAIYFKGDWNKKFNESATYDAQFRLNKNATKPVKMMYQKAKFPLTFIPEANCQILEMPYKGKELSMLIFLPNDIEDSSTGLNKIEQNLSYNNFVEWTRPDMMDEVEVQVGLPRFKMEENYDMKNVLVSMGMVDAFDMTRSDFSGMSPANDLMLSKVVHKAFVEVNEEGTEAAAATAAIMMLRCALPVTRFIADHPFLFFIRHNQSMTVLFAGRYCTPV